MLDRRWLAVLILGAWIAALGWQARRVFFPSAVDRLALGVRTLPPGVAYYEIYRGDRRAGWGQTEIDTLPASSGFFIRDRMFVDLPGVGPDGLERTSEEFLDGELRLDSLRRVSVIAADTASLGVRVIGDSLAHMWEDDAQGDTVALVRPVTTQAGWRLRLAAGGGGEAGDRFELDVFDPAASAGRTLDLTVLETAFLAFPDSADTDSISGAWIPVREDTVRAWRVDVAQGDVTLESWVDEDGRLVNGQLAGGYRARRTAFELAFFTRPGATGPGAPAGRNGTTGEPE